MSDARPLISYHCNTWLLALGIDCKCLDASLRNDLRVGSGGNWTSMPFAEDRATETNPRNPKALSTEAHTEPNFMGTNLISCKECGRFR